MNKEFIPYEQALELKELGFDEECVFKYSIHRYDGIIYEITNGCTNKGLYKGSCTAPLYQQAFRWFREKHNLIMYIQRHSNNKYLACMGIQVEILCDTYEEAELTCLKKLIEIVKNK
jgi:hypothetical protein